MDFIFSGLMDFDISEFMIFIVSDFTWKVIRVRKDTYVNMTIIYI